MARHAQRSWLSPVAKRRLVLGVTAAATCSSFLTAWADRDRPGGAVLSAGWGLFLLGVTVVVGSLEVGPRPLRSVGAGAWLLVSAAGALMIWFGQEAIDDSAWREPVIGPLMLVTAIVLAPSAAWLIIRRPEQAWERERRESSQIETQ